MRRRAESLMPWLVLMAFLVAAFAVNALLTNAQDQGLKALEKSVNAEVSAIAANQDQRLKNGFQTTGSLSDPEHPFELTPRSAADKAQLDDLVDLVGDSIDTGFYLVDATGTITQGVLFTDDAVGTKFEWPGLDAAAPRLAQGAPAILPVSHGLTTSQPVQAYVIPILGDTGLRGYFVFESAVAADSDFNLEIGALKRGKTGEYLVLDGSGSVIASNEPSLIAEKVDDKRLLTDPPGVHRGDGELLVLADVPSVGWRVAFRQDDDEFTSSLARPLESVGRLLVFLLLAAGAGLTILLHRRLRAARAEQERLERISEAQQEFISIVSHELRTPVAGVLGFLETTLDHWETMDDEERRTAVARASSNARRLQAMTRDVLDTQSVEAGRFMHVFDRLDLAAEVRIAVEAARDVDPDRTIELALPDDAVWISGDADRLQQVLANLIDNARRNSPTTEPVVVAVDVAEGEAAVRVTDGGAGIDPDSLERIFEKFVRGPSESVSGTGLGLYICRQIIDAHQGRIWAESPPGEGATFRFAIPLASEPAAAAVAD